MSRAAIVSRPVGRGCRLRRKARAGFVAASLFLPLLPGPADAGVTVQGHVYCWDLAKGAGTASAGTATGTAAGYKVLRRALLEVEFSGATADEKTATDATGWYRITHRNPLVGSWTVDVEVYARSYIGETSDGDTVEVSVWQNGWDIWPYSIESRTFTVGSGATVTHDVYLGGPLDNCGASLGHVSLHSMAQAVREAARWPSPDPALPLDDISRNTSIFYPAGKTMYNAWLHAPGVGWIDVIEQRYDKTDVTSVEEKWREQRNSLLHEFGHKVMHDVYWALSSRPGEHSIDRCRDGDQAFTEGWADFYAGAVQNWPTISGDRYSGGYHLEQAWIPDGAANAWILPDPSYGSINWNIVLTCDPSSNEGAVAAVLWDVFDPMGWEYMSKQQQDLRPDDWPSPLRWVDRIDDHRMEVLWALLKDHEPDCLLDETDVWQDGFWYYWLRQYGGDPRMLHGLKAILYNRGIETRSHPEMAPSIRFTAPVQPASGRAGVTITEINAEDRPFLYYNVAHRLRPGAPMTLAFAEDQPVSSLGGTWDGASLNVSVALPPAENWGKVTILVHDGMRAAFLSSEQDLPPEWQGTGQNDAVQLDEVGSSPAHMAFDIAVQGNYVYIADWEDGLRIVDVSDPARPIETAVYDAATEGHRGRWFSPAGVTVRDSLAYVSCNTQALLIVDVSDPRAPKERGFLRLRGDIHRVFLAGDLAYVAGGDNGLYVVDVSRPEQPRLMGQLDKLGNVFDVQVRGHYAYTASGIFGFRITDVSDPAAMTVVGAIPGPHTSTAIWATGDGHILLADAMAGLVLIDGARPTRPEVVGAIQLPHQERDVVLVGGYAVLANYESGVRIVDVGDPRAPKEVASFDTPGMANAVAVGAGGIIYVADGRGGLRILKMTPAT